MTTPGKFITLEGGEGAGKTTQQRLLATALEKAGKKVLCTREPGGTPGAEAIRSLLVQGEINRWDALTEVLLLYAARRDHVEKVIKPALENGTWVISDRFYDSTTAYQGYGLGLDVKQIEAIRKTAIGDFRPDITFVLDIPVETGLARAAAQQRYERMPRDFHERMRKGFLAIAASEPQRVRVIEGNREISLIYNEMYAYLGF